MNNSKNYVALHNHTHYSTLDGYATVDEYIKAAVDNGMEGIGLADHGTASGLYKFITRAQKAGITPVPGIEFYVAPENPEGAKVQGPIYYGEGGIKAPQYDVSNGAYTHMTVFAYNNVGLSNLFKLTSLSWKPENFYFKPRIDTNMLAEHSEGLIVTTGCPSSEVNRRFLLGQDDKAYEYANRLKSIFGENLYVEIMDHSMESEELERILMPRLIKLSKELDIPLIATNDSHYAFKGDAKAHERILAVATKSDMDTLPFYEGGTRFAFSTDEYYIKPYDEMLELYPAEVAEEALDNTVKLMEKCKAITLDYDPHLRPEIEIPDGYSAPTYLQKLIYDGFKLKRSHETKEVQAESVKRIQEEFTVLHSNDFIDYFLVVHDYIDYAHKNDIGVGAGRGCFVPGSKVKSNQGSLRNIEDIKIGDKVQTHDTTYQLVEDVFTYDVVDEDMIKLTLSNGKVIESTADHLIFNKETGFIKAEDLKVGDTVLGPKGRREKYTIGCDNCKKTLAVDKQEYDRRVVKDHYKPEGEYWCYDCVKSNLHNIPAVKAGSIAGAARQKDKDVKETMSESLKKHWAENYDERMVKWHAYMETPEYEEYRQQRRVDSIEYYSDPEKLEELANIGNGNYKSGYFTSYQQDEKQIYYASSYELKALTILETDSTVKEFDRCKRRLKYDKPSTGLKHNYLPDIEVVDRDGNIKIIEVKAKWQLQEEDTASKLAQAKEQFDNMGIEFEIWTEDTFKELNDDWHNDIEVVSVEKFKYTGEVHDLQVANVHNYNVEGITVHNSVGGSEIAYLLDISNTDPIRFDLLFERFLSPGRGSLYQIEYMSGDVEEIAVSGKKLVHRDGKEPEVIYVHELYPGDLITHGDGKEVIKKVFVKIPGSAPDVDTDFHTKRREEVIQYCVAKYGEENVSNIVTFGTFKAKSAFKAIAKVYNVPYARSNTISKLIPGGPGVDVSLSELMDPTSRWYNEAEEFRRAVENDSVLAEVVEIASALDGRISDTSVHPCGVIIANQPISNAAPMMIRQEDNKLVSQWEYPELEALGLIKMDFLGLELIDTVQQAVENIVLTNNGVEKEEDKLIVPDMRELILGPMDDPKTYETLQNGHTVGIFQLGNSGVRDLLTKVKPDNFMDIAITTALYRPGPLNMGSHMDYANRKQGIDEVSYIHDDFKGTAVQDILDETYGVLVFQEQTMRIAGRYAGMTPYETDQLRSAIGKKKMDVMMRMKPMFINGCLAQGASKTAATKLWDMIEAFGEYGFNKSHSVSYALNIYQSLYLKSHYPREFMSALIQQGFGNPNKVRLYIQEAVRMGLKLGHVDINTSQLQMASTGVDPKSEFDIVFGFSSVKQTNDTLGQAIVDERNANGLYKSVADFVKRISGKTQLTAAPLASLAIAGAFDCFGVSRKQVSEKAKMLISSGELNANRGASLFDMMGTGAIKDVSESIELEGEEFDYNELIKLEADRIGMFVSGHPTAKLGHIAKRFSPKKMSDVLKTGGTREVFNVLGTITHKVEKSTKAGNKSIAVLMDDGSTTNTTYLPREMTKRIEKGEEIARLARARERGTTLKVTKRSERLAELVNDPSIEAMDPIELNEPYLFKMTTRGWGEEVSIQVVDVERLVTAPDGSLPFELNIMNQGMGTRVKAAVKEFENKKGAFIKINHPNGDFEIIETRVKLSIQFIVAMEKIVGKENIVTEGI